MKYFMPRSYRLDWSDIQPATEETIKMIVPNVPGVYLLLYHIKQNGYYPFYAGETETLRARLLQHLSDSEPNKCIKKAMKDWAVYFVYAMVDDTRLLKGIERYLIETYDLIGDNDPERCNTQLPTDDPIEVNLPDL